MRTQAPLPGILLACCFAAQCTAQTLDQSGPSAAQQFATTCAGCHGLDGRGSAKGADIATPQKVIALSDAELAHAIRDGVPGKGMPAMAVLGEAKIAGLVSYIRTLQRKDGSSSTPPVPLRGTNGAPGQSVAALKEASSASKVLTEADRALLEAVDVQAADLAQKGLAANWTSYNGDYSGRRFSSLDQITPANAAGLKPAWRLHTQNAGMMQGTPVVVNGVMYVTRSNDAYAVDARTGKLLWHHARAVTEGLIDDASGHINRGAAVLGTRVYMETDNAHLVCLDARTGGELWDVAYAPGNKNYGATSAPLIVKGKVLVGTSGGDDGVRGFIAAFDAQTGKEAWRFWTIPGPGEKGSESWPGDAYLHGGGTTWMPGTYDPELNTLYWGTGNPAPDFDGSGRPGDDLYTSSLLALNPDTGRLKWYFQYSPHDLFDYDGVETPVLVDAEFKGRPRKLVVTANRNGYLYLLDRVTGEFLFAKAFVSRLNWAKGIDARGRPIASGLVPTAAGVTVCPNVDGATNWFSPAYDPQTGTFYFRSVDACSVYLSGPDHFQEGTDFYATGTRQPAKEDATNARAAAYINAFNLSTLDFSWRNELPGEYHAWAGVMSTAGGVVVFGNDQSELEIDDAKTGKKLWAGALGTLMRSSPMSYAVGGKQYIAVTAGDDVLAFSLP